MRFHRTLLLAICTASFQLSASAVESASSESPTVEQRLDALEAKVDALTSVEAAPTTAPADVRTQLRAAQLKIAKLEQAVRQLETELASSKSKPADTSAAAARPAAREDLDWKAGQKLDGQRVHNNGAPTDLSGSVIQDITGNTWTINSPDAGGGGNVRRDWVIQINGKAVTVKDIRVIGGTGAAISQVSGSGRITDDSITFNYQYTIAAGGVKNARGVGSVTFKKGD